MRRTSLRRGLVVMAGTLAALAVVMAGLLWFRPTVLISGSMAPALRRGDLAFTAEVPARSVRPGDVIVRPPASEGGTPVTHRVTAVGRDGPAYLLTTKGDANESADPAPLRADGSVRRVVWSVPAVGHVVLVAASPGARVLLFLVVVPGLLLVATRRRPAPVPA